LTKTTGRVVFSLFLVAVAGYVIYAASGWSFKTGFFPLAIAVPLMTLALLQLALELFGAPEAELERAAETAFSNEVSSEVARHRVIVTFSWIGTFVLFVYLFSFPFAVPLFIFLYLRFQSNVSWVLSLVLTGFTWGFFYALFERLIRLQFEPGWIQTSLGL
jgi:hypothetical protein